MSGMGRMGTLHGWQSWGDNVAVRRFRLLPNFMLLTHI